LKQVLSGAEFQQRGSQP